MDGGAASRLAFLGRVISVVSPKGGVAKTTVATNLAVERAQTGRHSTLLVDLGLQCVFVDTTPEVESAEGLGWGRPCRETPSDLSRVLR